MRPILTNGVALASGGAPVRVSREWGENPVWSQTDQTLLYKEGR